MIFPVALRLQTRLPALGRYICDSFKEIRGHLLLHRAFELLEFLSLAPDSNRVVFEFKRLDKDALRRLRPAVQPTE